MRKSNGEGEDIERWVRGKKVIRTKLRVDRDKKEKAVRGKRKKRSWEGWERK